jgi:hypothetical protein
MPWAMIVVATMRLFLRSACTNQGARRQRHYSAGRKMAWTGFEARRFPRGLASLVGVRCAFQWGGKSWRHWLREFGLASGLRRSICLWPLGIDGTLTAEAK